MAPLIGKHYVRLFGPLSVQIGAERIQHFRTTRAASILAYLALKPGYYRTRELLCIRFWPDGGDETRVRARLREELASLRKSLGLNPFITEGQTKLCVNPELFESDVALFEQALVVATRARHPEQRLEPLRRAVELYQGDLLPELYDDWVLEERERLRRVFFESVLSRLIQDLELLGFHDQAQTLRQRAQAEFPDHALPFSSALVRPMVPQEPLDFFGRSDDLQRVRQWLDHPDTRQLLTLTGMGGIGKTRLAREAVAGQEVLWVSLAEVREGTAVWESLRTALELPSLPEKRVRSQVVAALNARPECLLVLDNLEQVRRVPQVVQTLLSDCPRLRCLATSRKPLLLEGEREVALPPLGRVASEALFLRRARQVRPDFATHPGSMDEVTRICQLLEGVPLALELAAARALVLGPTQMRELLGRSLEFLVSIRPREEARHRSLLAAILWSYELLTPEAQAVFAQLAVFQGGFTLQAAQQVCGTTRPVVDLIEELALNALLQAEFSPKGEEGRYSMLRVIHEFAQSRLEELPDQRHTVQVRHRAFFVEVAQEVQRLRQENQWALCTALVRPERHNFGAALAGARPEQVLTFFDGLALVYFELGLWQDFEGLMRLAAPVIEQLTDPQRKLHYLGFQAALARRRGRQEEAWRHWEARRRLCEAQGWDDALLGTVLEMVGQAIDERKTTLARQLLTETRRDARPETLASYAVELEVLEVRLGVREGVALERVGAQTRALVQRLQSEVLPYNTFLYALHYLSPACRALGLVPELEWLLRTGIEQDWEGGRLFPLGMLLLELARHRQQQKRLEEAGEAFYIAACIHRELQSRLQIEAESALELFEKRYAGLAPARTLPWRGLLTDWLDSSRAP